MSFVHELLISLFISGAALAIPPTISPTLPRPSATPVVAKPEPVPEVKAEVPALPAVVPTPQPKPLESGVVPSILTRAVGEVDDRIITSREVRISEAIDQAIAAKPEATPAGTSEVSSEKVQPPIKHAVLTGQEMRFVAEVAKVLDEWVVYLEAKTLSSSPVAKADVAAAVKSVEDLWANNADWKSLEVSSNELKETIERKLLVRDFERLKSDPQLAPVSDEDALAYYRKNRLRFGSLPFSSFKDNIKAYLVKAQTERRLNEWREILRRKYKVRNLIAG